MYTLNAAWIAFAEQQRGSLRTGKLADFAVLNQDIMAIPADKLHQTESLLTFVDGQQVYPEQRAVKENGPEKGRGFYQTD